MRGFTVHIRDTEPIDAAARASRGPENEFAPLRGATAQPPVSEAACSENVHRTGQVVEHYRLVKLLAEGGTSRVYEAVHDFTKKPVALKIMRNRLVEQMQVRERFRREAMVLASIRHENVVAVDNAGLTDDSRVFIAMELLRGMTLRELLVQRGRLAVEEALRLLLEVASGVSAAHRAGVIHRDLKPENIFCVAGGHVKVLDLGTAKFAGENVPSLETAAGKIIGTVAYVAPERFTGAAGDARSDVYALGLIAYECLAGYHPMVPDGEWPGAAEMASRQVTYDPLPIESVSPGVWAFVRKAIHKVPSQRYQSVAELAQAIRAIDRSGRAEQHSKGKTATRRAPNLTLPIVAGAVFGIVVAGSVQTLRLVPSSLRPQPSAKTDSLVTISEPSPSHAADTSVIASATPLLGNGVDVSDLKRLPQSVPSSPAIELANRTANASRPAQQRLPRERQQEIALSQASTSTTEPLTESKTPAMRPPVPAAHESAPKSNASKDYLPASGL